MFRDILVAVDGSTHADEALAQAIDLAESEHTRLTLIAGVPGLPPAAYVGLSGPAFAVMQADARSSTEAVLRRARDRVPDDLPVTTILTDEPIRPAAARFDAKMSEFILPYDDVRAAESPRAVLLEFLQSTYEAGANRAGWDRAELEREAV